MRVKFARSTKLAKKTWYISLLLLLSGLLLGNQQPLAMTSSTHVVVGCMSVNANRVKYANLILPAGFMVGSSTFVKRNQGLIGELMPEQADHCLLAAKKNTPLQHRSKVNIRINKTSTKAIVAREPQLTKITTANVPVLVKKVVVSDPKVNQPLQITANYPSLNSESIANHSTRPESTSFGVAGALALAKTVKNSAESNLFSTSRGSIGSARDGTELPEKYARGLEAGLLGISVNNNSDYSEPKLVMYNESALCLESALFAELKIDPAAVQAFDYTDSGSTAYRCFVNGVDQTKIKFNSLQGNVLLDLPGKMLQANDIYLKSGELPLAEDLTTPLDAIYSNNTNYQVQLLQNMQNSSNTNQLSGMFSNTTSTPLGSFVANVSTPDMNNWLRNSAYWETDFLQPMTSLLIGDITPNAGVWGGVGNTLGGIQYGTNTALRPYANYIATPTISGVVDQPSQMDVLIDGSSVAPVTAIPAGAYNVYNLPVINGDGTLTVNLKNSQGTITQTLTMPYFSAPQLLQKGTYFYQYNLGLTTPQVATETGLDWGYQTNQAAFSTQHSYAFSNYYTLDMHSEAQSGSFYNFGLNHNFNLFDRLYSGFYTALSQAESGGAGGSAGITVARLANKVDTFGASYSYGLASPQFATLGYIPGQITSNQILQNFSISYATNFSLSAGLGYTSNSGVSGGGVSVYSANLTYQPFTGSSLMLQAAKTNYGADSALSFMLNFTYALKNGSITSSYEANNSAEYNNSSYSVGYQYFDPTNTWGYNLNEQYATDSQQPNTVGAGGYYSFKNFNTNANFAYTDNTSYNTNGSIAGNMIVARNGVNFARVSTGSFAIVKVGNLANVGVLLGDTYIGSTDRNGEFTVPNIMPYFPQQIKIRATDLPINTELDSYSKKLIAPLNGGVMLEFKVVHYMPAMGYLSYNSGQIPPVGYAATLFNGETKEKVEDLIIIDNGMIMISKFSDKIDYYLEFTVKSGNYSCQINKNNIDVSASNEYQYVLKDIKCTLKP